MKTRYVNKLIIPLIMIGLSSLGFTALGFFIISRTFENFSFTLLFGGLIFIWMGLSFCAIIFGHLKTIRINGEKAKIRKWLSFSSVDFEMNGLKYHEYAWYVRGILSTGIMIKLPNDNVETIGTKEYTNSSEIIDYIKKNGCEDKSLKRTYWTLINKTTMISGFIILIGFILSRIFE